MVKNQSLVQNLRTCRFLWCCEQKVAEVEEFKKFCYIWRFSWHLCCRVDEWDCYKCSSGHKSRLHLKVCTRTLFPSPWWCAGLCLVVSLHLHRTDFILDRRPQRLLSRIYEAHLSEVWWGLRCLQWAITSRTSAHMHTDVQYTCCSLHLRFKGTSGSFKSVSSDPLSVCVS